MNGIMEEYLDRIMNYLFDDRFTRAILIDGEWGCGKTFFVKNYLIPSIESNNDNDGSHESSKKQLKEDHVNRRASTLLISLYGIACVEDVQKAILAAYIGNNVEKIRDKKTRKIITALAKFGLPFISGVGAHYGVRNELDELYNRIGKSLISSDKDSVILIFDDVERCQIGIIELMGYLNNLCENKGYRVVLVANEKEIERHEDAISQAIEAQTVLHSVIYKQLASSRDTDKNEIKRGVINNDTSDVIIENDEKLKDAMDSTHDVLFPYDSLYERTKEKLIGLTIRFEVGIDKGFDDILDKLKLNDMMVTYIKQKKDIILSSFIINNHNNLRTLISVFIAVDQIMQNINVDKSMAGIDDTRVDVDAIFEEEKDKLLENITITGIMKGFGEYESPINNKRYEVIHDYSADVDVIRYAFVDDYWECLLIDSGVVKNDFNLRISDCIAKEHDRIEHSEHYNLALYKLKDWYYCSDNEIVTLVENLKTELKEGKYYFREYKEIISTLVYINHRMNINNKNGGEDDNSILDPWDEIDIPPYVELMISNLDQESDANKDSLRLLNDDSVIADKYNEYVQPLYDAVTEKELNELKISKENEEVLLLDGDNLIKLFKERRDQFLGENRFLSLYGYERIEKRICEKSTEEIYMLLEAINKVYNFGNLRDFFADDYDTVYKIWSDLSDDRINGRTTFNEQRSRTREIALITLEERFKVLCNKLRDPQAS